MFQICFPWSLDLFPPKGDVFCGHMWPSKLFSNDMFLTSYDHMTITWQKPTQLQELKLKIYKQQLNWNKKRRASQQFQAETSHEKNPDIPKLFFGHDIFMASQWRVFLPTGGEERKIPQSRVVLIKLEARGKTSRTQKTESSQQFAPQNS